MPVNYMIFNPQSFKNHRAHQESLGFSWEKDSDKEFKGRGMSILATGHVPCIKLKDKDT